MATGGRVFSSVVGGDSAEQLLRVIDDCAQGDEEWRLLAVNEEAGPNNETPLAAAHRMRRGDLVGALVENGADVRVLFGGRATPLAVCVAHGQVESVRALLRAGHDPDEHMAYFFLWEGASFAENDHLVSTAAPMCLAPPSLDDDARGNGPPQLACLEALVRVGGADVEARDFWGRTPLYWLARAVSDHEAALDLLLGLGADVNAQRWAIGEDDELILPLQPVGAPLIDLIKHSNRYENLDTCLESCVRKLLSAGARARGVYDEHMRSPLMAACSREHTGVARILLEAGAPVNERNPRYDETALHMAGCFEDISTCALLLDAGADVSAIDSLGRTPIFSRASASDHASLLLLLERGAPPDVIDNDGRTPLMQACEDEWEICDDSRRTVDELLRRSSAETRRARRNWDGRSAIDVLVRRGFYSDDENAYRYAWRPLTRWLRATVLEMLELCVPVLPETAAHALPAAASLAAESVAELKALRSTSRRWRAYDDVIELVTDVQELRHAQAAVERKRARVEALKQELRELGAGSVTEGSESGGSEGESDSDSDSESSCSDEGSSSEGESDSESSGSSEGESGSSRESGDESGGKSESGSEHESEREKEQRAPGARERVEAE